MRELIDLAHDYNVYVSTVRLLLGRVRRYRLANSDFCIGRMG